MSACPSLSSLEARPMAAPVPLHLPRPGGSEATGSSNSYAPTAIRDVVVPSRLGSHIGNPPAPILVKASVRSVGVNYLPKLARVAAIGAALAAPSAIPSPALASSTDPQITVAAAINSVLAGGSAALQAPP